MLARGLVNIESADGWKRSTAIKLIVSAKTTLGAVLLIGLLGTSLPGVCRAGQELVVGAFSTATLNGTLPRGWEILSFKKVERQTQYSLVLDEGSRVVKAVSDSSAAGLLRKISIDPRAFPIVSWKWKVENILRAGDVTKKAGDDYPARIYITFAYDSSQVGFLERAKYEAARLIYGEYPPGAAINYIWESKAPVGTLVPNPYTDRVQMVVVESGSRRLNSWVSEERNIYEDYKRAFGHEPSLISGVAIMTDTDNTGESAVAYYGDIVFRSRPR